MGSKAIKDGVLTMFKNVLTGCFKPGMRGMYICEGCSFSAGIKWCFAMDIRDENKENVYYIYNRHEEFR